MTSETDLLEQLGLSEAESKVYLALLETGPSLAGPIIKKTALHRGTTYQILQRLREKGLVSSVIVGKKQHFQAAAPERFLDALKEKEELLEQMLPALRLKQELSAEQQSVTVYSGAKGIRGVLDAILEELNPRGEYYDFGVSGLLKEVMGPYWYLWQKKKKRYKIKSSVIFNEELRKKDPLLLKEYVGEARFHPSQFASMTDTIIYKDTVVLFIWTAKPPVSIVIRNRQNAQSYLNQFKLLWKHAKR